MSLSGSCLCGDITYSSSNCQKWTGSTFSSNAAVPEASFEVTKGVPKWYDTTGESGKNNRHFFCPNCGSSLYGKLEAMPGQIVIKTGGLDNGAANLNNNIAVEFYCKDRVGFISPLNEAKQVPRFS
ncbi:duf636 domain protein [Trichoderma arundinaceum]|uniref:Duf636 domain protein n=1 Tax=Trichoderma arundinaceum TaxID=490622 RepID=A0A395NYN0_TRIAR|nr:duf636 domain protein [Trichoderma arundinaceum]